MEEVLVAYDSSGSTDSCSYYHSIISKIIKEFPLNCKIIKWNSVWEEITLDQLKRINSLKRGDGGTNIECVANAIKKYEFTGHLILITDGEVLSRSIDNCDSIMNGLSPIKSADIYIIGNNANMSVSCPFTRTCPHDIIIYKNSEIPDQLIISQQDIDLLAGIDSISDIVTFDKQYDSILKALTARMMGRQDTDIKIHDQIVRLQNRLRREFLCKQSYNIDEKMIKVDCNKALVDLKKMIVLSTSGNTFQALIDQLLNISKGGLRNTFNHNLRRAEEIKLSVIEKEELPNLCPISFDIENDIAVLMKDVPPLFSDFPPHLIQDLMNCPLAALNYKSVMEKIVSIFDGPLTSMNTGQNVLYLGTHPSQIQGTNAAIADIVTGGKHPGNLDLWYVVFYRAMEKTSYFSHVKAHADAQLLHRLKHSQTYAGLSNTPLGFNPRVSLGLAAWIVSVSPLLELGPQQDFSRVHAFYLNILHNLAERAGLPLPQRDRLVKHAVYLCRLFKLQQKHKNDRATFKQTITALYQRAIRIKNRWIPLDGPASIEQQKMVLEELGVSDLTPEETYYLASLTDPQIKSPLLSINFAVLPLPHYATVWPYGESTTCKPNAIPICLETCRPYVPWKENAEAFYKAPHEKLISCNESFVRFVQYRGSYPTSVDDFVDFMYNYYVLKRGNKTLPAPILQFANEVLNENKEVMSYYTPAKFIAITTIMIN